MDLGHENDSLKQMASLGIAILIGKHNMRMGEGLPILERDVSCTCCNLMRRINEYFLILVALLIEETQPGPFQGTDGDKAPGCDSCPCSNLTHGLDEVCVLFDADKQFDAGCVLHELRVGLICAHDDSICQRYLAHSRYRAVNPDLMAKVWGSARYLLQGDSLAHA
jgi:hypothetical protein